MPNPFFKLSFLFSGSLICLFLLINMTFLHFLKNACLIISDTTRHFNTDIPESLLIVFLVVTL